MSGTSRGARQILTDPHIDLLRKQSRLEEHIPALRQYAYRLARDPDDAADVVQMCLERAVRNFHKFEPGTNLRAWLFTIMHNEFVSEARRRGRRVRTAPLEDWFDPGMSGGQEHAIELLELNRALSSMTADDQEILKLACVDGRSYAAISGCLNLSIGTVKSRVFRARGRLHALLDKPFGGPSPQHHPHCPLPRARGRITTEILAATGVGARD